MTVSGSRRDFLKVMTAVGGGLLISVKLGGCDGGDQSAPQRDITEEAELGAFVRVSGDGSVVLIIPRPEMGQGVRRSLAMLLAEELSVSWRDVRLEQAEANAERYGPQYVGGSNSIRRSWEPLRQAGALARELLILAAAETWGLEPARCSAKDGRVVSDDGRSLVYGELATAAARQQAPDDIPLRARGDWKILGGRLPNPDGPAIAAGRMPFSMDVRRPGMLFAAIERAPAFGARIRTYRADAARAVEGVRAAVPMNIDQLPPLPEGEPALADGVAVVAESTWAAMQGRKVLEVEWEHGPGRRESTDGFWERCRVQSGQEVDRVIRSDGNFASAFERAPHRLEAVYRVPFLAHAPMEPPNAIAEVGADRCEIWVGTQNPAGVRAMATALTDLPEDQIRIHPQRMGGAFGRKFYSDFVAEAIVVSKAMGVPVQVLWTREDDVRHGQYRPAGYHKLAAGFDQQGRVSAWRHHLANASRHGYLGRDSEPGAGELSERHFPSGLIPNFELAYTRIKSPIPRGQWRGIAYSANVFVVQSMLDEIAHEIGTSQPELQLALLRGEDNERNRRLIHVIEQAVKFGSWGDAAPEGRGRGFAASYANGAFAAHVADVSLSDSGHPRVDHVTSVVDCGTVVDRNGAEAQVEGAVLYGLDAALRGEVTVRNGRVEQGNFDGLQSLRISEAPEIEVHFVNDTGPPLGLGEAPLPPIAPAVTNALFMASGQRIRALPITSLIGNVT